MFVVLSFQTLGQEQLNIKRADGDNNFSIFKQRIDHFAFGPLALKTFDQRYLLNNIFVEDTKNVTAAIIDIGGEGALSNTKLPGGNKTNLDILGKVAKEYNAPIYQLEHRFYGQSQPFPGEHPTSNDNLRYLSSRYAIADLINFISTMDKQYCPTPQDVIPGKPCIRWMISGGSYAGAVTAWITQQHQSWFAASISSSGVVDAHFELPEFDTHTLAAASTPCSNVYMEAMHEIERATKAGDLKYVKIFKAEKAVLGDFFYFLADQALMVFQYGSWQSVCSKILIPAWRAGGDVVGPFVDYLAKHGEYKMYDRNDLKLDNNLNSMFRQWWYQTCTEVAYFQPAPIFNSLRASDVTTKWHLDICEFAFGLKLGDPTLRTNNYYGAYDVYGDDTFFTNFWQDVWHLVGITSQQKNVPQENIGFLHGIDLGHCADLHVFDDKNDLQELKDVRQKQFDFVATRFDEWLKRV